MNDGLGIIIACCRHDYIFVKGLCASIRYFMEDVPITLLVDGDFSTDDLLKVYSVNTIYRSDVENQFLRDESFGFGLTKMVAFWESPYEKFLYLDADTIVWGNLIEKISALSEFDMITAQPQNEHSAEEVKKWFFDTDQIETYYPNFNWKKYTTDYFCTGVYASKRGIFNIEEYKKILKQSRENQGLFYIGEMGFLNFMIFRAADEGRIEVKKEELQLIAPDYEKKWLKNQFKLDRRGPILKSNYSIAIHYPLYKPVMWSKTHSEPMSFFRRKYWHAYRGKTIVKFVPQMILEDLNFTYEFWFNKVKRRIRRILGEAFFKK